jgi:hypothetical protein
MTTLFRQHDDYEVTLENVGRSPHNAKIPNSEEVDQISVQVSTIGLFGISASISV